MAVSKSIIVPCYNEAKNLPELVQSFQDLRERDDDWELVLVDNGSTDATSMVLTKELAKPGRDFVRVVTVPSPNVGYGHGIMSGLRVASGHFLAWTHADGQTPPGDVLNAFHILASADDPTHTFVKGRRTGRPLGDRLFTYGMQVAAGLLLHMNLSDINAQPKAFPHGLLKLAHAPPDDLSLDLYMFWLAKKNGYQIQTFNVAFLDRKHGESKWAFSWRSKWNNIRRTLDFMWNLN